MIQKSSVMVGQIHDDVCSRLLRDVVKIQNLTLQARCVHSDLKTSPRT